MVPRIHLPTLETTATECDLPEAEAHHLVRVRRLGVGGTLRVFDGRGLEREARLSEVGRRGARVVLGAVVPAVAEMAARVTVAQAVLKPEAMDSVVRETTMIGAASLVPVLAEHCAVATRAVSTPRVAERWQRIAVASAAQSGRAVVPEIHAPVAIATWLQGALPAVRLSLVEPAHDIDWSSPVNLAELRATACERGAALAIGPEGGWTRDEVHLLAEAGFLPWRIGGRILRAELAPVVALGILAYTWEG